MNEMREFWKAAYLAALTAMAPSEGYSWKQIHECCVERADAAVYDLQNQCMEGI